MLVLNNAVWEVKPNPSLDKGLYRVIETYTDRDIVVLTILLPEEKQLSKPITCSLLVFTTLIQQKLIVEGRFELPNYVLKGESQISEADRERRDTNYKLIEPLVQDSEFLLHYAETKRTREISRLAKLSNTYPKKITRLLSLFWRFGQTPNALLPAYQNSGGRGRARKAKDTPLGAPRKNRTLAIDSRSAFILSDKDKENMKKALKKHHLKNHGKTLKNTYKLLLTTYYSDEVKKAEALDVRPNVPSYRQLQYWRSKLFEPNELIKKSTTKRDYLLNKRSTLGSAVEKWMIPGSCFEIDATVADVHIVSSFGKQHVLGRPTIYSVVDRASRMIVGLHVSYYHASWRAARQALANTFLPKEDYCNEFGISIADSDWPAAHVPQRLMCDNGEMIGLQPQKLVVPLTELQLSPPYRPDFKAMVERRFGLLNKELIHDLLGTTRGGLVVRGDKDPREDAIYTLRDFTTLLIDAVLELNRTIYKDLARISPALIKKDLPPTPLNFWKVNLSEHRHSLKSVSSDEVVSRLYVPAKASVTRSGIEYNGLYYSCRRLLEDDLASIARVNGRWQVEARINENTTNYIYVRFSEGEGFTLCKLLPSSNMFKNLPFNEADFVRDWIELQEEKNIVTSNSIVSQKLRADVEIKAKQRSKIDAISKREKVDNVRENRRKEILATTHTYQRNEGKELRDKFNESSSVVVPLPRRKS